MQTNAEGPLFLQTNMSDLLLLMEIALRDPNSTHYQNARASGMLSDEE